MSPTWKKTCSVEGKMAGFMYLLMLVATFSVDQLLLFCFVVVCWHYSSLSASETRAKT